MNAPSSTRNAPALNALARRGDSYWIESRQPLASLVFIAPLLVTYEVGVLCWACAW